MNAQPPPSPLDPEPLSPRKPQIFALVLPSSQMQLTDLNHDVLALVTSRVASADIGSWQLLCKTVTVAAQPYRFHQLFLRDPHQVRAVCASVARTPSCTSHILRLTLEEACVIDPDVVRDRGYEYDGEYAQDNLDERLSLIAGLLSNAPNIVFLKIEAAETFLDDYYALLASVGGLKRLVTLVLEDHELLRHGTVALFSVLRAPVRNLTLLSLNEFPVHLFKLLQHVAPTLETLETQGGEIGPWVGKILPPSFPGTHTLLLDSAYVHVPTLEKAFPALRDLHVELAEANRDGIHEYQAVNAVHALSHWTHFTALGGDIGGLWSLSLNGIEVEFLNFDGYAYDEDDMAARRTVLRGVRSPRLLHFCVRPGVDGETLLGVDLLEYAPAVAILDLEVSSRIGPRTELGMRSQDLDAVHTFLHKLPVLLAPMVSMTYLRVLVDNDGFSYGSPRAWSTPDSATARQAFAQALFEQLPGLALVTLCWVEAHWPSTTYRRVDATMPGSGAVRTFCVPDEHTGQSLGSLRIKDLHTVRMQMRKSFDSMLVPFTINFDQDAVSVALASHSM